MKFEELMDAFCGKADENSDFILLSIDGVNKDQTVSADASPLLAGIKDWHVPFFDIVGGKLWVRVEPDERPF